MKFGLAKLPKAFYKIPKKKFKRKKKNNKKLSSIEDRKAKKKLLLRWKKKFCHFANLVPSLRGRGGLAPILIYKQILFLEHHVTTRRPTMMQKGIIIFDPTYLTKVTCISSILKFLNTESLVVEVSNTKCSIQSLHL